MKMSISNINHLTPINQTYNYTGNTNLGNNVDNAKEKTQGDILQENINAVYSVAQKYDVKNITPRNMAQMSQELYDNNSISLKNHAFMSFQPELNPSYNNTIGKFTHTTAQPDTPRNFLDEWKERLEEQLQSGASSEIINNTKEVISILDNLDMLRKTALA